MKPKSQLSSILILILILVGCTIAKPSIQPTQVIKPSPTPNPSSTFTPIPTETPIPTLMATSSPSPSVTNTPINTLVPAIAHETIQPLIQDPMNCDVPCFWGIIPGKTSFDEAKNFLNHLGFVPFVGTDLYTSRDFYTINFTSTSGLETRASLLPINNLVENIEIQPRILHPKAGGPREWIAYSPETLIKRFGTPSRVEVALDYGPNFVIAMNMYFDEVGLMVRYSGLNMISDRPSSPLVCPLILPFNYVRLLMGKDPPNQFGHGVALEEATSITIDQFTQLMLGDPQKACFTVNGDLFK